MSPSAWVWAGGPVTAADAAPVPWSHRAARELTHGTIGGASGHGGLTRASNASLGKPIATPPHAGARLTAQR